MDTKKALLTLFGLITLVAIVYLGVYLITGKIPTIDKIPVNVLEDPIIFKPISRAWDILTIPIILLGLIYIISKTIENEKSYFPEEAFILAIALFICFLITFSLFGFFYLAKYAFIIGLAIGIGCIIIKVDLEKIGTNKKYQFVLAFIALMFCLGWNVIYGLPGILMGLIYFVLICIQPLAWACIFQSILPAHNQTRENETKENKIKEDKKIIILNDGSFNADRIPSILESNKLKLSMMKYAPTIHMNCLVCLDEYIQENNDVGLIIIINTCNGLICNKHHTSFYEKHSFDNYILNDIQFYQETIKNEPLYKDIPILFVSYVPMDIIPESLLNYNDSLLRNIDAYLETIKLFSSEVLLQIQKMLRIQTDT